MIISKVIWIGMVIVISFLTGTSLKADQKPLEESIVAADLINLAPLASWRNYYGEIQRCGSIKK